MSEKDYGTFGPAVDAETFFTNPIYSVDGIDAISSKEFSCYISEIMDGIGYSYEMIKHRQQMCTRIDTVFNTYQDRACRLLTTGSKTEGTSLLLESDTDVMFVVKQVVCSDTPHHFLDQKNITVFQTDMVETSPGYTRLKLIRFDGMVYKEEIRSSIFKAENGSHYISSEIFFEVTKPLSLAHPTGARYYSKSGPSLPATYGYWSQDRVFAFRCICPNIIEQWMSRPRRKGWPSPETVLEISKLNAHVVPVGFKGSPTMDREWRICYSLAEIHLIRKLNEAQIKVYVLLKQLSKCVLKKVCKEITTYVMKNIVFWMCETQWGVSFSQESIMDSLMDCIQYLRKCVQENTLPSYMIPDRNLFCGRLDEQQRNQVVSLLDDLIKERGRMFLRCDKIRDAMFVMYKSPNNLREKGKQRDKVEKKVLLANQILKEVYRPGMSEHAIESSLSMNETYQSLNAEVLDLIQYEILSRKLEESGRELDEQLMNSTIYQLLSYGIV